MTAPEKDAMILKLYNAGFSYRRIAKAVGMRSPGSVARALDRNVGLLELVAPQQLSPITNIMSS
jgi:hypothetical protein